MPKSTSDLIWVNAHARETDSLADLAWLNADDAIAREFHHEPSGVVACYARYWLPTSMGKTKARANDQNARYTNPNASIGQNLHVALYAAVILDGFNA